MRKIVIIFICILCLSSCFPNEKFSKYNEKNKELIEEYITPISTGYKNDDGTKTLIVYSYPIRFYKNNKLIDIDISLVKKNDIYTVKEGNIVPEIPKILDKNKNIHIISDHTLKYRFDGIDKVKGKKKIKNDYVNISREMIEYDNIFGENTELNIYPTYFGTNNEIQLDSLKQIRNIRVIIESNSDFQAENSGYICNFQPYNAENKLNDIIQNPVVVSNKGYSQNINYKVSFSEKKAVLYFDERDFKNTEFPIKICFSVSKKVDKQADSSIYSEYKNINRFLEENNYIGKSERGTGKTLLRFQFSKNFNLSCDDIISVRYNCRKIYGASPLKGSVLKKDWCSPNINWNSKIDIGDSIGEFYEYNNEFNIDITDLSKKWILDKSNQLENQGIILESVDNSLIILTSNDNPCYINKTIIMIK